MSNLDITSFQCFSDLVGQKGEPGLAMSEKGERGPPGRDGDPGLPGSPGKEKTTRYTVSVHLVVFNAYGADWEFKVQQRLVPYMYR